MSFGTRHADDYRPVGVARCVINSCGRQMAGNNEAMRHPRLNENGWRPTASATRENERGELGADAGGIERGGAHLLSRMSDWLA